MRRKLPPSPLDILPLWAEATTPACPPATSNAPHPDGRLFCVQEVATYLGVSEKTVRRLVAAGDIAVVRIGRAIRVSPEELQRFLTASTATFPAVGLSEAGDE